MFRFIEKKFFKITQVIVLLSVAVMLVVVITTSYNNIDIRAQSDTDMPVVKFADYQKFTRIQEEKISKNLKENQYFDKIYNAHIDNIVATLGRLSANMVDKVDLKQKVKISNKIKLEPYSPSTSIAYLESLTKLINQVAIVDAKVNIDELIDWHDQSFFQQVHENDQRNFLQVGPIRIERNAYFAVLETLTIFTMLIIALAVLRIEKNTRK